MKRLFSIIIATYNSENYLRRTLESIISQDFTDYEILIVDGGSKDGTLAIVARYGDTISVCISEPDNGIYDAWNKGIKRARGQWIMFVGSDDLLLPGALSTYAQFLSQQQHTNLEYVSANVELITEEGKILRTIGKPWKWSAFKRFMCVAHESSIHNLTLYEQYCVYNTDYKITGDYELLLRAKGQLKAGYINATLAQMQVGGMSVNAKSFIETFNAKVSSGSRNRLLAKLEMMEAKMKYLVRALIS